MRHYGEKSSKEEHLRGPKRLILISEEEARQLLLWEASARGRGNCVHAPVRARSEDKVWPKFVPWAYVLRPRNSNDSSFLKGSDLRWRQAKQLPKDLLIMSAQGRSNPAGASRGFA